MFESIAMTLTENIVLAGITPWDEFDDLFPTGPQNFFYTDIDGEDVYYTGLPDEVSPIDKIAFYNESELTDLARMLASDHARYLQKLTQHEKRKHVDEYHSFGIRVARTKNCTLNSLCLRLSDKKWWRRQINKIADERREHLAQISKTLGKHASQQCCSDATVQIMHERKKKTDEFLSNSYKVVTKTLGSNAPVVFSLAEASKNNEKNRLNELFLDIKALEAIAGRRGWKWAFITLTAAPEYHSNPAIGRDSYNESYSARMANKSIAADWKSVQGSLKERGFKPSRDYFGFRVTEVHEDGCPHWHILMFYRDGILSCVSGAISRLYADRPGSYFAKNENNIIKKGLSKTDKGAASPASYIYNYLCGSFGGVDLCEPDLSVANKYKCALRAMGARRYQMFGVKSSRGKLRGLSVVKNKPNCPESIKKLADRVHVNAGVKNRNRKQLNARVSFFLGRAEDLEMIKECTINKFGEVVVRNTLMKHKADVEAVQIAGLCSDLSRDEAMAILRETAEKSENAISVNCSRGTAL